MAISSDGLKAIVGASDAFAGVALVYERVGGVWTFKQTLRASDAAEGDDFGEAVAIDGDTAIVGAKNDDDKGQDSGSAYVFVRSNGVWPTTQTAKLTASDGAQNDRFGGSVAVSGDTAIVGASADNVGVNIDKCPKDPGTRGQDPNKMGCPQFIERTTTQVFLHKQIEFEFNSATIARESYPILDEIGNLHRANEAIEQLRIEGYTDNVGSESLNRSLSQRRAEAVRSYLVERAKVHPSRLSFAGFGPEKPIAPNNTDAGRAKNRRVELHIGGAQRGEEKRP